MLIFMYVGQKNQVSKWALDFFMCWSKWIVTNKNSRVSILLHNQTGNITLLLWPYKTIFAFDFENHYYLICKKNVATTNNNEDTNNIIGNKENEVLESTTPKIGGINVELIYANAICLPIIFWALFLPK